MCGNINIIGVLFIQISMSTHMWTRSVLACRTTHDTNGSITLLYCITHLTINVCCAVKLFGLSDYVTHRLWVSNLLPAKLYLVTHGHICKLCIVYTVFQFYIKKF